MQPARADQSRYLKLLPLAEVKERIIQSMSAIRLETENLPVDGALARVCAEDVQSERDVPPRSVSAMDGYAVNSVETSGATSSKPVQFLVKGTLYPESVAIDALVGRGETYYISTGAPVPRGADSVVRVENTRLNPRNVEVVGEIPSGKNVNFRGEDVRVGQLVARKGTILNPAKIALLISAGRADVKVFRTPRVGILSIGNELRTLKDEDQGKTVNNYSNLVSGYLAEVGANPLSLGVAPDDPEKIGSMIREASDSLDALITIGGSSVGARDFAPTAVESAFGKVESVFHGVRVVPIRPAGLAVAFGRIPIAILPGHAVSAALSFQLLVLPMLNLLSGLPFEARTAYLRATLSEGVSNERAIDALYLVRLDEGAEEGGLVASPLGWGSNVLSKLAEADGFIHLSANQTVNRDDVVAVRLLGEKQASRIKRLEHK